MGQIALCGSFKDFASTGRTIERLVDEGFDRRDLSVIAPGDKIEWLEQHTGNYGHVGAAVGAAGGALGLVSGLTVSLVSGAGLLAGGPIGMALAGGLYGAAMGGLLGALVGHGVPKEEAQEFAGNLKRGEILLVVSCADAARAGQAEGILRQSAEDVSTELQASP